MALTHPESADVVLNIRGAIESAVVGQSDATRHLLASLIAGGHVLLEGVPGVGKTLLVLALSRAIQGRFSRIQFTPDLMPSDVTGHMLFDRNTSEFRVRPGPIFGNLILADEINRAPAKTQAALLEVMQEYQVTIEGSAYPVPKPFMVVATQNPVEQEGTYPLPEAQLDRFLVKVLVDYPDTTEELAIVRRIISSGVGDTLDVSAVTPVCTPETVVALRDAAAGITVDDGVASYAVEIARATRSNSQLSVGAGPRAAIALVRLARAFALIEGRDHVVPDDIKDATIPVLRHRVSLMPAYEIEGLRTDDALARMLEGIAPPRQ